MKKGAIRFFIAAAVLIFAGIFLIYDNFGQVQAYKNNDFKDINTAAINSLQKDDLVVSVVDTTWGPLAEEYQTTYGIRTSKDSTKLYYLLDMRDYYIIYETSVKAEYGQLDAMMNELYAYCETLPEDETVFENWSPTLSLQINGVVTPLDDDIRGYCQEMLDTLTGGYGKEEMAYVADYMISHREFDHLAVALYIGIGMAAAGLLLAVVGIILAVRSKRRSLEDFY